MNWRGFLGDALVALAWIGGFLAVALILVGARGT